MRAHICVTKPQILEIHFYPIVKDYAKKLRDVYVVVAQSICSKFLPKSDKFKRKCRTSVEHGIAILFFDKKILLF